jgi:ATP-dependent Clp protease ATP-binding subunit ClpC
MMSESDIMKVDFDKETSQITIIDEKGESKTPTEEETK